MKTNRFELPEPTDDGFFIPDVGPWSREKHYFLRRYLDAFTNSMKDKPWPGGRHYIDLFAGAGIERLEQDGKVYGLDWGSPLIAAQVPVPFRQLHLVELEKRRFEALAARLGRFPQVPKPQLIRGDANGAVDAVVRSLPPCSLSVAFLDPFGLHLHFATLRKLSQASVDFIIFFPDHSDALRNWEVYYEDQANSNLDLVLGHAPWRAEKKNTPPDGWAAMLLLLVCCEDQDAGIQVF